MYPGRPRTPVQWRYWAVIVILLLLFLYYDHLLHLANGGWYSRDHFQLQMLVNQRLNPSHFSRDYLFGLGTNQAYYTPVYLGIMAYLIQRMGDFPYATVVLHTFSIGVYLTGMTLLLWNLTKNYWLSFLGALSTGSFHLALGAWWELGGRSTGTPRELFTASIPWLVLLVFFVVSDEHRRQSLRWLLLIGLATGLLANLHPPSGLAFAGGVWVATAFQGLMRRPSQWVTPPTVALGIALGASPVVWGYLQGVQTNLAIPPTDFDTYFSLIVRYFGLIPRPWQVAGIPLPAGLQTVAIFVWAAGTVTGFIGRRKNREYRIVYVAAQLIGLLVTTTSLDIILLTTTYWILLLKDDLFAENHAHQHRISWWLLDLSAGLTAAGIALPILLFQIAQGFELSGLTSLIYELQTTTRLAYFPCFIFALLFASYCLSTIRSRLLGVLAALSMLALPIFNNFVIEWSALAVLVALALIWMQDQPQHSWVRWAQVGLVSLLVMLFTRGVLIVLGIFGSPWPALVIGLGTLIAGAGLLAVGAQWPLRSYQWAVVIPVTIVGLAAALLPNRSYLGESQPLTHTFLKIPATGVWNVQPSRGAYYILESETAQLVEWVKTETPPDSLIWTSLIPIRAVAQRSIAYGGEGEIKRNYYTPALMVWIENRYRRVLQNTQTAEGLLSEACDANSDYIIVDAAQTAALHVSLPTAFENGAYIVYVLDASQACSVLSND